ncbi:hypothetical protein A11A3_06525 [Alcanivorax hongdengensis A-11-3]|uniref:SPOR domain-containing protein n=1 Tax=Alcanivorax hongdengensis A-11-3 TaxID=1177179 RepID=L0WD35_9GAMM|nr:hypothetical protein A11A3_06525 [Alcanivorax hongdengensis A-11-3]
MGTLFLLVLAAFLVPLLFRSPEQVRNALDMHIPKAPAMVDIKPEPVISKDDQQSATQTIEEDHRQISEQADKALAAPTSPEADKGASGGRSEPDKPGDPSPVLAGFTVQVASFVDEDNARALVARLKEAEYRAYLQKEADGGQTLYRVFVGPDIRKADAQKTRQTLADDSRFALQGLVRTYVP